MWTRRTLIAAGACATLPGVAGAEGRWHVRPAMPFAARDAAGARWRDELLVAGGVDGGRLVDKAALYDPAVDRWKPAEPLPFARSHAGLGVVHTERYASAGFPDAFLIGGYRTTATGERGALAEVLRFDMIWTALAPMPEPRAEACVIGIDGLIHVIAGRGAKGADLASHIVYDPEVDDWRSARPCPTARRGVACAETEDGLLLCGGLIGDAATDRVERFDVTSDKWSALRPLPRPASGLSTVTLRDRVFLFGGKDAWVYDGKADRWVETPPPPSASRGAVACEIRDDLYIAGGVDPLGRAGANFESFSGGV